MKLSQSCTLRLVLQLDGLPGILGGATATMLKARPKSGKWSVHENLAHIGRMHEVYAERIRRILTEDEPRLPRYRAEEDPSWPNWAEKKTEEVLEHIRDLRRDLIAIVEGLTDYELTRGGIHSKLGLLKIPEWLEFFLLHEAHHLYRVMYLARGGE